MTEHDLKEMKNLGAELGAAKAENEKLRGLLREAVHCCPDEQLRNEMKAALSQQAELMCETMQRPKAKCGCHDCGSSLIDWPTTEPTDTYTAVEMATAAAQGFRDGQAAVEPAPAQDEREAFEVEIPDISAIYDGRSFIPYRSLETGERLMTVAQHLRIEKQLRAALTRPAQTEQQPDCDWCAGAGHDPYGHPCQHCKRSDLFTAFAMHQRVRKTSGSEWQGRICGTYSTELTPEGYAVESEAHAGSVQIYPAKALEAVE